MRRSDISWPLAAPGSSAAARPPNGLVLSKWVARPVSRSRRLDLRLDALPRLIRFLFCEPPPAPDTSLPAGPSARPTSWSSAAASPSAKGTRRVIQQGAGIPCNLGKQRSGGAALQGVEGRQDHFRSGAQPPVLAQVVAHSDLPQIEGVIPQVLKPSLNFVAHPLELGLGKL
eukprot:scaffold1007_cov364-Prasinococcus_capsulatus_cf.AAC.7